MKVILETRRVHSLDINVFINTLMYLAEFFNFFLPLSVPDEGYFRNALWTLIGYLRFYYYALVYLQYLSNLLTLSVLDEGYSRNAPCTLIGYLRFYYFGVISLTMSFKCV